MSEEYNEDELAAILNEADSEEDPDSMSDMDPADIASSVHHSDHRNKSQQEGGKRHSGMRG